ncbi:hypothetical protein AC579_7919 [Pseudocercospora musae]|uniref:Casein kinase substrate phosphoprotein PP28 domain-containing protein n=1 Tax=Pseudocercospora musae TaxID=113226 RepID=A0A139IKI6_9PEZI|nr:hypothetical protein AC579_7919 [Pseudocercospora musae]
MSSHPVAAGLGKLKISHSKPKSKNAEPAESWEDDADLSSNTETEETSTPATPGTADYPAPPPPTPSSPVNARDRPILETSFSPLQFDGGSDSVGYRGGEKRPEKTTAVASRLIAAGLGQKAPKRSKEQREYDQAMKVQEKQKRDQARAEEERKRREAERAKKAVWDD